MTRGGLNREDFLSTTLYPRKNVTTALHFEGKNVFSQKLHTQQNYQLNLTQTLESYKTSKISLPIYIVFLWKLYENVALFGLKILNLCVLFHFILIPGSCEPPKACLKANTLPSLGMGEKKPTVLG